MATLASEFPRLKQIRYFDVAVCGIVPASVGWATLRLLNDQMRSGTSRQAGNDTAAIQRFVEAQFCDLLGARSGRTFIASSAISALDSVLQSLSLPRKTIVCSERDYPDLIRVASRYAGRDGRCLKIIKGSAGKLHESIDSNTSAVIVSHVDWITGDVSDLSLLSDAKAKYGFKLIVDASQSLPILDINVEQLGIDVLVCAGYKWLAGNFGSAVVYVSEPVVAEISGRIGEDLFTVVPTTQSYAAMFALGESLRWMKNFGLSRIREQTLDAARAIRGSASSAGWPLIDGDSGMQKSGIVNLALQSDLSCELTRRGRDEGLHVAARGQGVRFSPHFTATEEDCQRAFDFFIKTATELKRDSGHYMTA